MNDCDHNDFERNHELPLSNEEKRRLKRREATSEVPEELAALDQRPAPPKTVKFIDRATAIRDAPAALDGNAPPWLAVSLAPKRAPRPRPPVVTHRGERLDPLVIHPPENRTAYNDPSYPWGCVCRIVRPDGARGSGVLIGPRHVLTASHVVEWGTNAPERIEVHFAGNSARAVAFTDVALCYTKISGDPDTTTVDEDYAVIVLTERLGDRFGFFGAKVYDSAWDDDGVWATMGYAPDVGAGSFPLFQLNTRLDEDELDYGSGRAMTTSADAIGGQSGSPMFGTWPGDPVAYVVAVVSATGGGENWCAGGSDLNGIIRHARTQHP